MKRVGVHVAGRAYTVWLDEEGKPVRVMLCGNRVQNLCMSSKKAQTIIARATGA